METQKLNPTVLDYTNRKIEGLNEKDLLLTPNSEITIKIKVSKLTLLKMWFETINLEIAKNENKMEI